MHLAEGNIVAALKDPERQYRVPSAWRSSFEAIVDAFVGGDYGLREPIAGVVPLEESVAIQIEQCIRDYGEKLAPLSDETWESSVCQWMEGYWDLLVDLNTEAEGRSDMVLSARVRENEAIDSLSLQVSAVYVP
ncbi:DUF7668 domain-containing protein [Pseudomarimonas salicorniae]|uniref:DUF7668 domain-containing protein n=1 Tax=Pseudomarimonas salicorniae TaxID=2933270 RepID=UPI003CCD2849